MSDRDDTLLPHGATPFGAADELLLRKVLENSRDGISMGTPDGRVVLYNRAMEQLSGYTIDEVNERGWFELVFPDPAEREAAVELAVQALDGRLEHAEALITRKDGDRRWVSFSLSPVSIDGSDYNIGIMSDVTDRRQSALQRENMYRRTVEQARLGAALNAINDLIHSSLQFDAIMERVVGEAAKALGADASAILLGERGSLTVRYQFGFPDEVVGRELREEALPAFIEARTTKRPVLVADTSDDDRVNREIADRLHISSALTLPLIVRGEVIGMQGFYRLGTPKPFNNLQVEFAGNLGVAIGLAIENSRLYAAEHAVAEQLQDALVELPTGVRGLTLEHVYRSAAARRGSVGGDFYDVFELGGDSVGLVIGDVSGKGLEAAVFTSLLRNAIRAHSVDEDTPADVMRKTNRLAVQQMPDDTFATAFLGVLDRASGVLCYVNAGHPAPLLIRASGEVVELEPNGSLVGAFDGLPFDQSETVLGPGDMLLLYTDGVLETRRRMEFFGFERLRRAVENCNSEPKGIAKGVIDAVLDYSDGELMDDVALLVVRFDGTAQG